MKAKLFKKLIAALPDDAEIMLETKPDDEDTVAVYLNYSD